MATQPHGITNQSILQSAGVNYFCMRCQSWPHAAHLDGNTNVKWSGETRLFVLDGSRIQADPPSLLPISKQLHALAESLGLACLLHGGTEELVPRPMAREGAHGSVDNWQNSAYNFTEKARTCCNERTARPQALVAELIQALTLPNGRTAFSTPMRPEHHETLMRVLLMLHACPMRWKLLRSSLGKWADMVTFTTPELSDLKRNTEPGMKPSKETVSPTRKGKKRGHPNEEAPPALAPMLENGGGSEVERVRRITSQTWSGSTYMYERATFGMNNVDILRAARPLVESAAKSSDWRSPTDTSQICGCKLREHYVAGVAHIHRAQHSSTGKWFTICSVCGLFCLFRPYREVTGIGYVCNRHPEVKTMPMPADGIARAFPPRPEALLTHPDSLLNNHPFAIYERLTHGTFMGHTNRKVDLQIVTRPVHLAALDPRWCDANRPFAEHALDLDPEGREDEIYPILRYVQRHACRECVRLWALGMIGDMQEELVEPCDWAEDVADLAAASELERVQPITRARGDFGYARLLITTLQRGASSSVATFQPSLAACTGVAETAAFAHATALTHDETQFIRLPNGTHVFCTPHYLALIQKLRDRRATPNVNISPSQ